MMHTHRKPHLANDTIISTFMLIHLQVYFILLLFFPSVSWVSSSGYVIDIVVFFHPHHLHFTLALHSKSLHIHMARTTVAYKCA